MPAVQAGLAGDHRDLATICNREAGDEILGELATRLRSVTDANRCYLESSKATHVMLTESSYTTNPAAPRPEPRAAKSS